MENELAANASVEAPGPEQPLDGIDNIDITESLSSDQIQNLFDACDASDWSEVDRLIDSFEKQGIYPDSKAGGADRNSGNAEKLRRYWTTGPGGAKIGWGASGDWTRCVSHLSKYLGPRAKGYCALRHKEMNGFYPGDNANKSDSPNNMAGFSTYHETKQPGELGEPMLEHKTVGVKGMNVVSAEAGIVETIISVTGVVDNVKDRIMPGAYEKTLAKRKPKGVWCVDTETEALTADGWKSYTDLRAGDLIYTLGEDGLARFQPVQVVNVFPAESRRMRQITTSVHSSLTTENHRWLVQTRDGSMRWRTTGTLVPEDKIVRAAPGADLPDEPKYNDAFVQVVAWFWTEGHIDGKRLSISQSSTVNPDKCRRIEGSLTHVFHGAWNVQTKANGQAEYRLNHAPSAAVLAVTGDDKAPTADFLRSLTQAQLSMFVATCVDGDGHRQDDGAEFFYQRSTHSVGMFQMACALAGIATNTVLREYDDSHYGRPVHRITLSKRATTMPLKAVSEQQRTGGGERVASADEWVEHDGVVWCPTTPAGTWLARRDGTVWFTGNSHDWDTPVSKTLSVKELLPGDKELPRRMPNGDPWPAGAGALKVKTQFNLDTQRGREAYSDVTFFGDEQEWCVDPETEILTDRGWLRYDEVAVGDQAYVLDPQYATGRFEPISAVNVFPVKERTVRSIQTGGFSSVTTSAHRWPVADNSNGGHVRWTTTAALDYRDRIIRSAPRMDAPATPKYADAFVETVGWFWNEGWVPPADHPDAGLYIAQSTAVNPQHVASIRAALDAAFPGRWSEAHAQDDMARFRLKRDAADAVLAVTGAAKEPTPEFLASLTRSQLRLLIDVCMSGDGHATKSGQWTWYQVADAGVGAFQMLCALAGVPTNATPQKDYGNRYGRPPTRVSLLRSGVAKPIDAIRVKGYGYKTGSPRTVAEDEWVQSTGVVWCPTTESGTWMARRRGTVYVTGNSIGYNVPVGGAQVDTKSGVREIGTLELYEYSPVLFGAMPLARTTSVKEAQLALKALKGGAASWLNTESAVATTAEYTAVSTDDDEADTIDLSGDDMLLVKTAIQTLTDLLNAVETETKGKFPFQKDEEDEETDDAALDEETEDPNAEEEESDVEEEPEEEVLDDNGEVIEPEADTAELGDDPGVGTDPKARLDAALAEAAQNPPEEGMWGSDNPPPEDGNEFYTSMAEAVDDLIDDAVLRNELIAIADEIDTAMDEEDAAYFEEAVRLALDKIEENLGADDEADLKELAEIIADSIEQMGIDVPQEEVDQATETGDYATDPFAEKGAEDVDPNAEVEVDPDAETAPDEDPVLDEEDPALTASDVEAPEEDMPEDPEAVEESSDDEEDDKKKKGKFPFAKAGKSVINVSEYKSLLDELRND